MTIRFDDAWQEAQQVADAVAGTGADVVLVRDLLGRVSLILDGNDVTMPTVDLETRLRAVAGRFAAPVAVRWVSELFDPDSILRSPELIVRRVRREGHGSVALLERTVVGADWTRTTDHRSRNRVTLYGFKGGVGRSTATFMLAQHFAQQGKCVLAVDLDLESPGLGALAQKDSDLSEHGLVDHLVEAAVDNADALELVSRSQLISGNRNGEVWLAPAAGQRHEGYLDKLNRIYSDLPGRSFGARLEAAIGACEDQVAALSRPADVVLLDSRAGIHDIAAVALTQLGDLNLLFAADHPQTWTGYRALFEQWGKLRDSHELGFDLKMVSSLTPDADPDYLKRFRDNAQQCFAETLYDQTKPGELEGFNFSVEDESAPHSPLPILFNTDLVALDPVRQGNWHAQELVEAAFRKFVVPAAQLIVEG